MDKLQATLAAARERLGIKPTSSRTPHLATELNAADCVERHMQRDGHESWGWIIYRCTYKDQAQWDDFMDRLDFWIYQTLEWHGGLDMGKKLDVQVHENKDEYDGASPEDMQGFFRTWVRLAAKEELGETPIGRSQRYRFCVHVDQEALDSITNAPEPPQDLRSDTYVNLIRLPVGYSKYVDSGRAEVEWKAFEAGGETGYNREQANGDADYNESADEDDDEDDEDDERVEGADDAVFMRVDYTSLMVDYYAAFRSNLAWSREYRAPPEIALRGSRWDKSTR